MEQFLIKSPYWLKVILINAYGFLLATRRFSGSFNRWFTQYTNNLKKSPGDIKSEQFDLLKNNLIYCYEKIPYYKRTFDEAGFNPRKMTSFNDITILPFLTKDVIRKEFDNLYNKDIPAQRYSLQTTSGSTGEKLNFFLPKELSYKKNAAFMYRFYGMWGVKPKDRRVTIGGRIFTQKPPYWVYNRFEDQLLLSAHHLKIQTVASYIEKINSFGPIFIQGHPSAILLMAKHILAQDSKVTPFLKVIFTTGETLLEEDQITIEKAFKCPVAQQYGSREDCFSAQRAPNENGYLVNYEHGFIELIGDGDVKEVVVTSLQNDVMPFVRYKMNDYVRAIDNTHSKQFNLPILFDEVIGRVDDTIFLKNGDAVLPVSVRMTIKPFLKEGTNYQLIQWSNTNFKLSLLDPEKKIDTNALNTVLRNLLGNDIEISVGYTESLISKGGKIRNIIREKD